MEAENKDELLDKNCDEEEPKFESLDTGWSWVVLVASFCTFSLMGAAQFASGVVYLTLLDRFDASIAFSSLVSAVHISMISIAGLLGTAFAPNIEFVLVSYGLVAGIGGALGYTANMVVVALNFQMRRNLALGIAVAGAGVGICLFATIMQIIYDFYKSTGFFLIMAGIYAHIIVFGLVCYPSKLELYSKHRRKVLSRKTSVGRKRLCTDCHGYWIVLKNVPNLCLCFGMFTYCLGTYLMYLHLPKYIVHKGFSAITAANIVSVSGFASIFGRLLTGILASFHGVSDIVIYCCTIYVLSLAFFIYPAISYSYIGNLIFSIMLGGLFGSVYVLLSSITAQYVGITNVSKGLSLQFFCAGFGALLGPVTAGVIVDLGGTYTQAIIFAACCLLVAGISSNLAPCFTGRGSTKEAVEIDVRLNDIKKQNEENN